MMSSSVRNIAVIRAVPLLFWAALATGSAWPGTADSEGAAAKAASGAVQSWSKVRAELPTSQTLFPPGKMRNAYGAPLPPDQVGALARYLLSINGRHPPGG
jgi:hypothetical protein